MLYCSEIVKININYISKYQQVKLKYFLRLHQISIKEKIKIIFYILKRTKKVPDQNI